MLLYSKWITYPTDTDQGRHAKYGSPLPLFQTGKINDAQGYYHSPFGRIDMQWNRTGTEVTYEVTLPQEINAAFDLERYRVTTQETLPADPGRTTYRFTFAER